MRKQKPDARDAAPFSPSWRGYGFGWVIGSVYGHKVIEHEGAWQGFTTSISRYADDRPAGRCGRGCNYIPCGRIANSRADA